MKHKVTIEVKYGYEIMGLSPGEKRTYVVDSDVDLKTTVKAVALCVLRECKQKQIEVEYVTFDDWRLDVWYLCCVRLLNGCVDIWCERDDEDLDSYKIDEKIIQFAQSLDDAYRNIDGDSVVLYDILSEL